MKRIIQIASLMVLVLLVFVPLQPAAAQGTSNDGKVVFGQSFTLKKGETLSGDLLVFGGTAMIEAGATVNGNVVLFGGSLVINGEVGGDVAVTGGAVVLGAPAHIRGSLTTVGTSLERADGAQIDGQISNTGTSWVGSGNNDSNPISPISPIAPVTPAIPRINLNLDPFGPIRNAFGQAVGLALISMLVMLFLAPHADKVAHAVIAQPLTAGALGLLTVVVSPLVLILLVVTILLIPVAAVAVLALVVACVFGWIAIGYEIGQRFTAAIHQNWHPAFSAGLGVFALTLVGNSLAGIPVLNCVGWLVPFLLGVAGLGAVIMTRFGSQTVLPPAIVPMVPLTPVAPASPAQEQDNSQPKKGG